MIWLITWTFIQENLMHEKHYTINITASRAHLLRTVASSLRNTKKGVLN